MEFQVGDVVMVTKSYPNNNYLGKFGKVKHVYSSSSPPQCMLLINKNQEIKVYDKVVSHPIEPTFHNNHLKLIYRPRG